MADEPPSTSAYAYQKPSVLATRSLVRDKPVERPAAGSQDVEGSADRPVLQRKTTDHYEQAVQASKVDADDALKPTLDRQQSWNPTDMKRGAMAKMLGDQAGGHGYTSTDTKA